MGKFFGYGWMSYYFNLMLLTPMSHQHRVRFIQRKAQVADSRIDPERRLRLLLHCTDWPLDLLQITEHVCACEHRRDLEKLQQEMVERYKRERQSQLQPRVSS